MTSTFTKIAVSIAFVAIVLGAFSIATGTNIISSANAQTTCGSCGGGSTGGDGGGDGGDNYTPVTPTCSLTLSKTEVTTVGESYTVTWNGGPASASFFINGAAVADSGSATFPFVGPNYDRFHMVGNNGGVTCDAEVRVIRKVTEVPRCESFTASPVTLPAGGGTVKLTWDTTNATNASIDGQSVAGDGTWDVSVTGSKTFTLNLSNSVGNASCQTSVTVAQPTPLPTCTLTANPTSIVNGGSSVLSWTTTNASSTSINQGIGAVTGTSRSVSPTTNTTYTMTVTNGAGSATCAATVNVTPVTPDAPRCDNFDAAPITINRGQSSVLSWNTTNATAAMVNNGVGAVNVDGSTTVSPLETTTYTMSLTGSNNQTASCVRQVIVVQPTDNAPRCDSFTASDDSITRGESTTLTWNTTNGSSVVINPSVGSVALDGSTTVSPSDTTTYNLTVTGSNNQTANCSRTITVSSGGGGGGGSSSPKCTLKISDSKIRVGDRITLKWDTSRATEITLKDNHGKTLVSTDGKKSADKKDLYDGEITLRPEKDTTYTLLAERGSKDRTCKVSVDVSGGVTVLETRDQKPVVTGIALTQVPYTGFEAGPFLTMVFYGLLLLWALYLAYVLVVRRRGEGGLALANASVTPTTPIAPVAVDPVVASSTISTPRFVAPVVEPAIAPVVGYEANQNVADEAYESIASKIEDAAHAERVLISSEAMRHFINVTTEEIRNDMLTSVLAKAKASYPAEDGWVVLNIDRMKSVTASIVPVVSVFTPRAVHN